MASELESELRDTAAWGSTWLDDFNIGTNELVSFGRFNNTGSIDVKTDGSVIEEKLSFKILRSPFFYKLEWDSFIISIAKTASNKFETFYEVSASYCFSVSL